MHPIDTLLGVYQLNRNYYPDPLECGGSPPLSMKPITPRQVLLFAGHMVDAPNRAKPRFPAHKVPAATRLIEQALARLDAGPTDLALTQGAAGGDLLFATVCAARRVRMQLLLPLSEPEFIERSILPSTDGEHWRERYLALKTTLENPPRILPDELGPDPEGSNPFERCNLWLLETALAYGADKLRFICLWDGGGGDGAGGTAHLYEEIKTTTATVIWIDSRDL